ncbi:MAG TPA: cytochrome c peroxidase, partial [Polyangiaceae bacterium]|nr:cytochrome c peroxidase [Polyangiaceae bacterium]
MSDSASSPVKEGDLLAGKYRVERILGVGGMGVVVAARHEQLDQHVAIKFVRDEALGNEDAVARFLREARAAVRLKSEHAARVLDVGTLESGAPYMVMEYLEGSDLGAVLRDLGPLSVEVVAEYVAQACEAVAEAHAAGIVHRDLKPQNLFLTRTVGGGARIKVLDFGVSKTLANSSGGGGLTQTRSMLGSPLYMSPEQMRSSRDVDARSDVWAFGVVLFELLTRRWPYEAETMPELVLKVVTEPPQPIAELRPDLPQGMIDVVERCLKKDPADRYADAGELALALEPFAPPHSRITMERARVAMSSTGRGPMGSAPLLATGETPSRSTATPAAWGKGQTPAAAKTGDIVTPTLARAGSGSGSGSGATPRATATLVAGPSGAARAEVPAAAAPPAKRIPVSAMIAGGVLLAGLAVWQLTRSHEAPAAASVVPVASSAPVEQPAGASSVIDEGRTESFGPLPVLVSTASNPLSDEKIALGRMLYYDERLSKDQTVSCNTCHQLDKYGVDGKKVSTGDAQQEGTRNSPSVYNSAGYFALMWDGKFPNVEEQAAGPLLKNVEMDETPKRVEQTLTSIPEYVQAFARAFPGEKTPLSFENVKKAIGAFERKLFTPSRWEKYLAGEKSALTAPERVGFNTFVETGCPTCHFGPY